jgi:hypothetical protein
LRLVAEGTSLKLIDARTGRKLLLPEDAYRKLEEYERRIKELERKLEERK